MARQISSGAEAVDSAFQDAAVVTKSDTLSSATRLHDVRALFVDVGGTVAVITEAAAVKSETTGSSLAGVAAVAAQDILDLPANPSASDTVTVATKDGSAAAVYTFVSALTTAFQVLIGASAAATLANLAAAINAGAGSGVVYGTGTTANHDVTASQIDLGQIQVTAITAGTAGNALSATSSLSNGGGWQTSTLSGGVAAVAGPSVSFTLQASQVLPLQVAYVLSTGTSASGIKALL